MEKAQTSHKRLRLFMCSGERADLKTETEYHKAAGRSGPAEHP